MPPYGDHGGVLQKNGADIPLINEDFSQELKDIIYKCLALNPWDRPTARQIADYTSQHINGSPVPFSLSNNSHDTLQEEEDKTHEDSISALSSDINKMSPYIRNNCHHLFANKRQRTSSGIHTGTDSND